MPQKRRSNKDRKHINRKRTNPSLATLVGGPCDGERYDIRAFPGVIQTIRVPIRCKSKPVLGVSELKIEVCEYRRRGDSCVFSFVRSEKITRDDVSEMLSEYRKSCSPTVG